MSSRQTFLIGAAAGLAAIAAPAKAQEILSLRLASSPVDDVMPVLYAEQTGMFRKVGLEVQLTRANSGSAVASAVAGGATDIGKSSLVSIINARARNIPFVFIAPGSIYVPSSPDGALLVAVASPIKSAKELSGKIIGVPSLNDLNTLATKAWIDQNGGDSKAVQFVEVPASAQIAALTEGRIAAAGTLNPYLGSAVDSGKARILANFYSAIGNRIMLSGWFTTEEFVQKHRDAVAKFQRVVDAATTYTNAHKAETQPLLASWTGITAEQAAKAPRMTNGNRVSAAEIQPVIDQAAKYGFIPKAFDARELVVEAPR